VERRVRRFVEEMGQLWAREGYAPIAGRVFGRLLVAPEPLPLTVLARELGVSKASVSTDTRRLERRGILERVRRPGDRQVYYQVSPELPSRMMEGRIGRITAFLSLVNAYAADADTNRVQERLVHVASAHGMVLEAMRSTLGQWQESKRAH
jgi:DNA-binding Lrp family transcriptional regulator